ncbi:MAG: 4Fe-4S dicluster domain-containing protein [Dehalococcoidia bacterium]|nr:4Fe-4S dicluster domain-containing protein [Dehalococcoidia bacterium]
MTVKISKTTTGHGLRHIVEEISGVDLSICYQCRKCTAGCPVATLAKVGPSEIIRRLQLGAGNELLDSGLVWMCLSCETCFSRCPMQINSAAVIDALRVLAVVRKATVPQGNVPLMNSMFLKTVETFGRTYDLAMIMAYKLGSGTIMNDTNKFPAMLQKGKMAILPPSVAGRKAVMRIFRKSQQHKGSVK